MKIIEKYSHLNGEEYLIVHHKSILNEIIEASKSVDAEKFRTKVSNEKTMKGKLLYNPDELNKEFDKFFQPKGLEGSEIFLLYNDRSFTYARIAYIANK